MKHKVCSHHEHFMNDAFLHAQCFFKTDGGKHTSLTFKKIDLSSINFEANHAYLIMGKKIRALNWWWTIEFILIASSRDAISRTSFNKAEEFCSLFIIILYYKFMVKFNLILHTLIYIYIYIKRQRELNPSLQHSSEALKPLRYTVLLENRTNETVYK